MPPNPRSPSATPSTSAVPYDATDEPRGNKSRDAKKPRLKACDACKLRRVLCLAKPPPASCPRCIEKGIVCTTTPVVRKKPTGRTGKRIEEARATFGTIDVDNPELMGPTNTPWITPRAQTTVTASSLSLHGTDARLAFAELDGALVAHLLGLYQTVPQSWLPLYPRGRIQMLFEQAGRRLEALPPQAQVLALTICATSARLSSHPAVVGEDAAPSTDALTPDFLARHPDLRAFGQRREAFCQALRDRAVRLSWERGTLVETCAESMSACFLLEMLEGRSEARKGKPYGSAFVSHLRTILDSAGQPGAPTIMNMSLGWSALIMREALYALNFGRTSHFSAADDILLCGEPPASIEETLLENVESADVRDSITLFFRPMRPYTYHVARLARECSDKVTGTYPRRLPLDERYVTQFLSQLDHLHALLVILSDRIAFVLSPAASAAHALPGQFERERQYIMRACLHTIKLAWCSLVLPLYLDLKRRVGELGEGPEAIATQRRRTRERVELLLRQVHLETVKAARIVAESVRKAPSLAFLTHLTQERLGSWVEILMQAQTEEEGGNSGLTRADKASSLAWLLDGLKTMGWSWTDDSDLIVSLEAGLAQMQISTSAPAPAPGPAPAPVSITQDPTQTLLDFGTAANPAALAIDTSLGTPNLESLLGTGGLATAMAAFNTSGGADGFDMQAAANMAAAAGFDLNSLLNVPLFGGNDAGSGSVDESQAGTDDAWMNV